MSKRPHSSHRGHRREPLPRSKRRPRSLVTLLLLLLLWSLCLGWGLSFTLNVSAQSDADIPGTVDRVPERFQLGKELYLENCATCHVGIPPETLPSQTWRQLLLEPEDHYGQSLEQIARPSIFIVWDYLRAFSRPKLEEEDTPFRLSQSKFFQALHPKVDLPQTVRVSNCVSCHPGAPEYNYRTLAPEWRE